jgi:O-antigen ligase
MMPIFVVLGAFVVVIAVNLPFLTCVTFVALSFFRIHEAFPILLPLHLPLALSIITIISLVWHVLFTRSLEPFWPKELKIFLLFFLLVLVGLPYAVYRELALDSWLSVYWKIGLMTVALAWLARTPRDFQLIARVFAICGLLIAGVTIRNKFDGIGLVELTRVTIGRDVNSVLDDPNELALLLLFPLSFALALTIHRLGFLNRVLGLVSVPALLLAIVYTQSRGAILGIVAVLAVFGFRLIKTKTFVCVLAVLTAVVLYDRMAISERISGGAAEPGIDESAEGRLEAWSAAVKMANSRPLTGVGYANFAANLPYYAEKFGRRTVGAHSTWFGVLGETGWPGFVVFTTMVIATFRSALDSYHTPEVNGRSTEIARAVALGILAGLAGFCAAGSFLSEGFTWPIYILLALAAALARYAKHWQPCCFKARLIRTCVR